MARASGGQFSGNTYFPPMTSSILGPSLLEYRPFRPTGTGRPDPRWATERSRRQGYAHQTTKRATCRNNGPRPTGDQTRGHDLTGAAAPRRNRYRTSACTRGVEGIQPEAPGWMRRGTDRTVLYIRRQVEGIRPGQTGRTEQHHISAVGATAAPRSTARLTF